MPEDFQRLLAGRCCYAGMTKVIQHGDGIGQNESVVVDCQDNERDSIHPCIFALPLASTDHRGPLFCSRKPKLGGGSFTLPASQRKPSSGLLGDTVHHGQAESRALAWSLGGEERFHRALQRRFIHSLAGILHCKTDVGARFQTVAVIVAQYFFLRRDHNLPTIRHGVSRVDSEIEQYHFELVRVPQHRFADKWKMGLYDNCWSQRMLKHVGHPTYEFGNLHRFLLKLLATRKGQHSFGQQRTALCALNRVLEQRPEFGIIGQAFTHQFEAAQHGHQQVVEIAGDPAGELPDRFHFLRLQQGFARCFELPLCLPPFSYVAGNFSVANQLSIIAPDGVDDHVGPKPAAVLADAPAFFFQSTIPLYGFQHLLRLARFPIFIRVKYREVISDNFLGCVPFDAVRAEIPVRHNAFWVEHVNGVVGNTLHQQFELLLALLERFLSNFAFGQVARDLRKTHELSCRGTNRIDDHKCPESRTVLADPPTFAFELPFPHGGLEREGWYPPLLIFLGVKPGKGLTDNFGRCVSLDALRAGIPARHDTRRIQYVDGVVGYRLYQETITSVVWHGVR